jgi:putative phage-type endonuclease
MNDLEELQCILDTIVFEDEPNIFTEENTLELIETMLLLMDDYMINHPTIISEPDFEEILLEEVKELFIIQFNEVNFTIYNNDYEEELDDILEIAFSIYVSTFGQERSLSLNTKDTKDTNDIDILQYENSIIENSIIENKINKLRNVFQPDQRTDAWYAFRHNLITASNAYKAFESQATMNQLIYEKCQPLKINTDSDAVEVKLVNTNTTLHWGQKYEPLSVMIYENKYNTKVEDFGCIRHETHHFLGASPDGIIVNKNSDRYGRMLEIKNVVNREITGIPKKEYWIQMQLQMEVCDLDECDFLETKFIEYPDVSSFYNDIHNNINIDVEKEENLTVSKDGKTKGIILYFHTKEGKPFYNYKPLDITSSNDIKTWEENEVLKYESDPYNYVFLKFIYWKLEICSCVLVLRNSDWFNNNIGQLEKVWKIIEEERITGYGHRAPNKKTKKEVLKPNIETEVSGCLLQIKKIYSTKYIL